MSLRHLLPRLLPAVAAVLIAAPVPTLALDVDLYAELLERHTRSVEDIAGTRVDYGALRRDPDWKQLVDGLAASDPDGLAGDEQLAFWINAYNILTIDVVAKNYPLASIKDVGSLWRPVWKREAGRIDGKAYTLDGIEHGIVRPLGDPRAHAALVCASLSCPPLLREPYRAGTLDAQLDANFRTWLADPRKGVRAEGGTLYVSSIFKWFAEDFQPEGGTLGFVERYGPPDAAKLASKGPRVSIVYLDYDWSLNDTARAG